MEAMELPWSLHECEKRRVAEERVCKSVKTKEEGERLKRCDSNGECTPPG